MSSDYEIHVAEVVKQVPEADPVKVAEAFARYEKDFLIPPEDAIRSVLRRFQTESGVAPSTQSSGQNQRQTIPAKKVENLSDLSADDRNVEIEVQIITHNPRTTMVRGEEKIVPYGLLEDQPWNETGAEKNRWEYKDWGNSPNLMPGSVVRLEGVSVNEYQGKMSLNINQSSRIAILKEGERTVMTPGEPVEIGNIKSDGNFTLVGRILTTRDDVINRKDGSGSIDVVRGRIADETGAIGFLSWEPFHHEVGSLVKIENAQVRVFRNTPEINIGSSTRIEIFHDSNFSSAEDLNAQSVSKIEDLRDGSRDVEIIFEIQKMVKRDFKGSDGEDKSVWSGDIADPTGKCRCSIWTEPPFDYESMPVIVRAKGARIRAWQGIADVTIDDASQIEVLAAAPWGDDLDLSENIVEVSLTDLANGTSRVGISTVGSVVSVREDTGIIHRCSDCRRVLRDGECATHGSQKGVEDLRCRLVLDDGQSTISLILNRDSSEKILEMSIDKVKDSVSEIGTMSFVQLVREKILGKEMKASGRTIVDDQGAMLLSDSAELVEIDSAMEAAEIRAKWGLN